MTEKDTLEIFDMNYQRNGVSGVDFYTALISVSDVKNVKLIATFEVKGNGKKEYVKTRTCRVIDSLNIRSGWRGDSIGFLIEKELNRLKFMFSLETYYDVWWQLYGRQTYKRGVKENDNRK